MCFERPAGSFRKNAKTRLCRFFVGEHRAAKHICAALRFQPYGRTRRSPSRRVAANKIRETALPDGLPFLYHCFSPLYTDAKARCKQAKTCASFAVSPSQGTAQPTAAWKNRRAAPQRRFGTGVYSADSTGGKIPFRSFLHSLHARRRAAVHLSFTAFPMRVPADTRPAAPSQRRRKRKEVRRFPRLRSYGIRFASIPVLLYAIHGLLVGKTIKFKLVNQSIPRKGAGAQIAFRLFSGLLVPIGAAVIDGKTASSCVYFSNSSCLTKPS